MAVANFQYITRMSSGFKVYILEGQPHFRSEDRYRHMTNDRARAPAVYPIKRKRSHERGLTLEERRERAMSRSNAQKVAQRAAAAAGAPPVMFSNRQSPTSSHSPVPSPTSPLPTHVYYTPVMDEPLALIKKPRKDPENSVEKTQSPATSQIQMRPSVITRVSSSRSPSCKSEVHRSPSSVVSKCNYDHVLEEHFQRSLGVNYQKARNQQLSISVSVDDHFAKALGDKWLQIKSKSSSCSSTPPSSPSVTHSPTYSHSPNQCHKESTSSSSPNSSHWPVN
ncbi:vestigial like 4 like [Stegastes partitus]|uniref:Transcription cofactor vestigial-like protein 4 n=1 Tax=Stegastes partitus TaxID=144197 RepID=A0A3B5ADS8_9TELE|nr:PREDICTED: transcription cofactor vestigial-like protein 4 [Stegastes partitus]